METQDQKPYVIVRSAVAGVLAGYMEARVGQEVTLTNARKIWYWEGAATLAQMANEGVRYPLKCKFPAPVSKEEILDVSEILYCTDKARKNLQAVPEWRV